MLVSTHKQGGKMKSKEIDWVFDLDGTLYSSVDTVWQYLLAEMTRHFTEDHGLAFDGSVEEQSRLRKKWNTKQTTIAYLNEFNLDFDTVIDATHLPIVAKVPIQARHGLTSIRDLPGKKWILTNSPDSFARAMLKRLEIEDVFDGVYGIHKHLQFAKPDPKSYARVPVGSRVFMIEDWDNNLLIPHQLGWTTVHFPEDEVQAEPQPHIHNTIRSLEELYLLI